MGPQALEARLAERLATAVRFMGAEPPALLIMHGVTASGKSWLSERLVSVLHAVRIRSDLERKRPAGIAPFAQRASGVGEGDYSAAMRQGTYDRLLVCAESALDGARNVIIDATFLDAIHREMFRALALRRHSRFLIVSCVSDAATLEIRLATRARCNLDPSEATQAVLDQQLRYHQPLTAGELRHTVQVDTGRPGLADAGFTEIRKRLSRESS